MTPENKSNLPEVIQAALGQPSGARFYRCALQVNPYPYLERHSVQTAFADEAAYNEALVAELTHHGVEVIAITDHYRIKTAMGLAQAARDAGIAVFMGFESATKDGVHILCLFDPDHDADTIDRYIGDCGIHDDTEPSPLGQYDVHELLDACKRWGGVCIAAHVASTAGLLETLQRGAAIKAWRHPELLACSLPGPMGDAPDRHRPIIQNKNADYKRDRPIAVLNCQDISDPADLAKPGSSCWIKMSDLSVDGLRQAFLDPDSRIRLSSDPEPDDHTELVAIAWEGGFLDDIAIHLNENLNVLIGGRGAGKSTVVESIRYVLGLEPLGAEAARLHAEFIKEVLRSGTRISLLVRSHYPTKREYLVERTVPEAPVVRDTSGSVKQLSPVDIAQGAEVYGQHEISELTRSPEKLTHLLERFVRHDEDLDEKRRSLVKEIRDSRTSIVTSREDLDDIEEQLATLPALRETLKRFQEVGLEEKLSDRSDLIKEEAVLKNAADKVDPFRAIAEDLEAELPIDASSFSSDTLKELPAADTLEELRAALESLSNQARKATDDLKKSISQADLDIAAVRSTWDSRRKEVEANYQKTLRELQSDVDAEEFVDLKTKIEQLRPLEGRKKELKSELEKLFEKRRDQLASWTDVHTDLFRELEKAAKRVNKQLTGRVKASVSLGRNLDPLEKHLRKGIKGLKADTFKTLREQGSLSVKDFADNCRQGKGVLIAKYSLQPSQAEKLAGASAELLMELEEIQLPTSTEVQLNVAQEGQDPVWRSLEDLSTGQKATAVLLLLLLESPGPLIVDQPEDDLDNRFITEGVVPKIREEKRRRQFVFATHNANIPVLGDAELIVGLAAEAGKAHVPAEYMGSIDVRLVREMVEETLEGGRDAFEMRRLKYGF